MHLQQVHLLFVCVITLLAPPASATTIYRCTVDGVATFSQQPCGEDVKEVILPTINVAQSVSPKQSKAVSGEIENYITIRKIDRNIALIEREIKQLQDTLAEQKTKINYITQDTANRMGASSIADAIAQRTVQAERRIKPQIEQYQQQLEALNTMRTQLSQ